MGALPPVDALVALRHCYVAARDGWFAPRALIQPLCAILGGMLSACDDSREGPAPGGAAAARLVAPIRTKESILACLHTIFEREDVSDTSQARL